MSAASTSKDEFQIKCHGDEGVCSTIFTLKEIGEVPPSSALEGVLISSFEHMVNESLMSIGIAPRQIVATYIAVPQRQDRSRCDILARIVSKMFAGRVTPDMASILAPNIKTSPQAAAKLWRS